MGVPAFFRWVSEKYPKILERAVEEPPGSDMTHANPNGEFDNLYLDVNGIIHPATHPEHGAAPATQVEMFQAVCAVVERLFRMIRPRKILYLAVDGIAPRAKMNQQRTRRFRTAIEAEEAREAEAKVRAEMEAKGLPVPPERPPSWDSNVITPGTQFMDELSVYMAHYIAHRQSSDETWAACKVILSDAQSPGEGEHKLMQFIRRERAEPGHDPNTKHCLCGLDADLIMLALASHEVHFTVLREEVVFGKKNQNKGFQSADPVLAPRGSGANADDLPLSPRSDDSSSERDTGSPLPGGGMSAEQQKHQKPYDLVRVWVLREYLAYEFRPDAFQPPLPFPYDFERCIDDFVFMCFFVGNDFLPHLPSLQIREGALELLMNMYRQTLGKLDGYLTLDGDVNLKRAGVFIRALGVYDDTIFKMRKALEEREAERKRLRDSNSGRQRGDVAGAAGGSSSGAQPQQQPPAKRSRKMDEAAPPTMAPQELVSLGKGGGAAAAAAPTPALAPSAPPPPPSKSANKSAAELLRAQLAAAGKAATSSSSSSSSSAPPPPKVNLKTTIDNILKAAAPVPELGERKLKYEERVKELADRRTYFGDVVKDEIKLGEEGWKERYYRDKFGEEVFGIPGFLRGVVESYVRGLCWVMTYYYKGCQSWSWFYEYNYAPFASDLLDIDTVDLTWAPSEPFKPFEQLLGVLPPHSAHALPEAYARVMEDPDSEIADFYPRKLTYDPDGRPQRWQWVCIIPFVDEARLKRVAKKLEATLTPEESRRNSFTPDVLFVGRLCAGRDAILAMTKSEVAKRFVEAGGVGNMDSLGYDVVKNPAPTTTGDVRGGGNRLVYYDAQQGGGLSGFFLPSPADCPSFELDVPLPRGPFGDRFAHPKSGCFTCEFREPPLRPHLSALCYGVEIPPAKLVLADVENIKAVVHMGGMDISRLSGYGDTSRTSLNMQGRTWGTNEPSRGFLGDHWGQPSSLGAAQAPPPPLPLPVPSHGMHRPPPPLPAPRVPQQQYQHYPQQQQHLAATTQYAQPYAYPGMVMGATATAAAHVHMVPTPGGGMVNMGERIMLAQLSAVLRQQQQQQQQQQGGQQQYGYHAPHPQQYPYPPPGR